MVFPLFGVEAVSAVMVDVAVHPEGDANTSNGLESDEFAGDVPSSPALALSLECCVFSCKLATLLLATLPFRVRPTTTPDANLQPLSADSLLLSVVSFGVQWLLLVTEDMLPSFLLWQFQNTFAIFSEDWIIEARLSRFNFFYQSKNYFNGKSDGRASNEIV